MKHNPDLTLTSCSFNETKKIDSFRQLWSLINYKQKHKANRTQSKTHSNIMRFMLSIRNRLNKRSRRIRAREIHKLITEEVGIRAPDNELKNTYFENQYGYDENFAEAVIKCLQQQEK